VGGQYHDGKITLQNNDQVYIKGHHQAGLDYIVDITRQEDADAKEKGTLGARKLYPGELVRRFCHCFQPSPTFTGKIKLFNCSSGVNGGESFAKPAASLLRAFWPKATYIGYTDVLLQQYGNYSVPDSELGDKGKLRALLRSLGDEVPPIIERRKLGKNTGVRAKNLQIEILEEEKKQIPLRHRLGGSFHLVI